MTVTVNEFTKFKEMVRQHEERKIQIENEIEQQKKDLIELGDKYQIAIINDQDEEADALQKQISDLQHSLKRNEDKLELMNKRLVNAEIEAQADRVLQEINGIIDQKNAVVDSLKEEYMQHRQKMLECAAKIAEQTGSYMGYVTKIEYVANLLPEWAKKQSEIRHYPEYGNNNPYRYQKYVVHPTLPEVTHYNLRAARLGRV